MAALVGSVDSTPSGAFHLGFNRAVGDCIKSSSGGGDCNNTSLSVGPNGGPTKTYRRSNS